MKKSFFLFFFFLHGVVFCIRAPRSVGVGFDHRCMHDSLHQNGEESSANEPTTTTGRARACAIPSLYLKPVPFVVFVLESCCFQVEDKSACELQVPGN